MENARRKDGALPESTTLVRQSEPMADNVSMQTYFTRLANHIMAIDRDVRAMAYKERPRARPGRPADEQTARDRRLNSLLADVASALTNGLEAMGAVERHLSGRGIPT